MYKYTRKCAVQSWVPHYAKDTKLSEKKVQKYATSFVPKLWQFDYEERPCILNLHSLSARHLGGELVFHINPEKFFISISNSTKSWYKLYKATLYKGLLLRKNFYSICVISTANSLPLVSAQNVDTFQGIMDLLSHICPTPISTVGFAGLEKRNEQCHHWTKYAIFSSLKICFNFMLE